MRQIFQHAWQVIFKQIDYAHSECNFYYLRVLQNFFGFPVEYPVYMRMCECMSARVCMYVCCTQDIYIYRGVGLFSNMHTLRK